MDSASKVQIEETTMAEAVGQLLATPKLFLLPVPLSSGPADRVLPALNIALIGRLRYFVVENLRSARRFLKLCDRSIDIDSLHFVELSEHTPAAEVEAMLRPLADGHSVGVISEAGCPAVADPGADIVAAAHRRGFEVYPLVGPSSILMALMASGFNGQSFVFSGYLPIDDGKRAARLREMQRTVQRDTTTQIFIETPYRNNKLIQQICHELSADTRLCVACDITGPRSCIRTMTVAQWRRAEYDFNKVPAIFLLGADASDSSRNKK